MYPADDPLLLSGTNVMQGSGTAVVTAVGPNSAAGLIQSLLQEKEEDEEEGGRSVLQAKLFRITVQITIVAVVIAVIAGLVLIIRYSVESYHSGKVVQAKIIIAHMMTGITILVVAIPEGLPLAVTISLAYSVRKMMADNNLVRHLHAW